MGDKEGFLARVAELRVNPDALDKVVIPEYGFEIPNAEGKRNSLQIFAKITDNDGYITPEGATTGLKVFGEELRADARKPESKHTSIQLLERIAANGKPVRSDVYRNSSLRMHPFTDDELQRAADQFGTPTLLYHEGNIRRKVRALNEAFSWVPGGFINHLALKATDCIPLFQIVGEEGMGADCASIPELIKAQIAGMRREEIMFTSNATSAEAFIKADKYGVIVNFDDITHIPFFQEVTGNLPEVACLRYNPGARMMGGDRIIGEPGKQKYGIMHEQMADAVRLLQKGGVKRIGLHEMIVSNELRAENLIGAARGIFDLANELTGETGVKFEFVNLGGGIGVPYRPEHRPIDINELSNGIRAAYESKISGGKNAGLKIRMENGRWVTGDSAVLLMRAVHIEQKPAGTYIKVDASGNDFARVEQYGAYHHLVCVGNNGELEVYQVAGPKCENSDHFAKNRLLPRTSRGQILGLCGTGAHGHPMCGEYNSFFPCGEAIVEMDGSMRRLTRGRTLVDNLEKYEFEGSSLAGISAEQRQRERLTN